MPSNFLASSQPASHRRSTLSSRQRENRAQASLAPFLAPSTSSSTFRDISPDYRAADEAVKADAHGSTSRRKKRHHSNMPSSSNSTLAAPMSLDVQAGDRGRLREKAKAKTSQMVLEDTDSVASRATSNGKSKRKERSVSSQRVSRKTSPEPGEREQTYSGPIAQAEYTRMKTELENAKKLLSMARKAVTKQSKVIDDLRKELTLSQQSQKEQSKEIQKITTQSKKSEELVTTIEANLTCQICMDILQRPHGLSPCGHILCQPCLQEWFRSSPSADDEMHDDDHPDSLLYRKKTCPCCRAVVYSRPIPLFLVKSLASAYSLAKASPGIARPPSPPPDADPWAGIFREPIAYDDEDWSGEDEEDEGSMDDEDEEYDDHWHFEGYGTDPDDERYEGPYVMQHWTPPTVHISPDEYNFLENDLADSDLSLLRRGATYQMIDLFAMEYTHEDGIKAVLDDGNVVYLGWNIELHPDDEGGEEYMEWVASDVFERPERWQVIDGGNGEWTAWMLIREDEYVEFPTTDSEAWAEDMPIDFDDE